MTLRHLKIFLSVCKNGNNLTRAAEALYISQPAVSLALKELEEYYGIKLFERFSRQLKITEAGIRMREYAIHILALFDDMEKEMHNWDVSGILRIGASITIGSQFMPGYVSAFQKLYPGIDVRVRIGPSEQLEQGLLKNELDLALIEGSVHSSSLMYEEYMEDRLNAICSVKGPFQKGEKVSAKAFFQQRFLLREKGSGTREAFDSVASLAGVSVEPVWEATSTVALVNAAIQGLGVAVLPERMIQSALHEGKVIPFEVEGISFSRHFVMVYHKNKFLTGSMQSFMKLCKNSSEKSAEISKFSE